MGGGKYNLIHLVRLIFFDSGNFLVSNSLGPSSTPNKKNGALGPQKIFYGPYMLKKCLKWPIIINCKKELTHNYKTMTRNNELIVYNVRFDHYKDALVPVFLIFLFPSKKMATLRFGHF